jgi:hypothetical protein
MQTIVISVQTRDVGLAARGPLVITINQRFHDVAIAGEDKTNRADNSRIHNESAPALWTWFVENPRPTCRGSWVRREAAEEL